MACMSVVSRTLKAAEAAGLSSGDVEFVFEDGDLGKGDFEHIIGIANRRVRQEAVPGRRPIKPAFRDKDERMTMLQAADFAAWHQRNAVARRTPPDQLIEPLQVLLAKYASDWGVVEKPSIREHAERIEIPKRGVVFSQRERAKWEPTWRPPEPS
jgi:hypothetical protein